MSDYRRVRARLRPLTPFGTRLRGDTLFGQLCWAARERWGEERLRALLDGYLDGRPFAVLSDACPPGLLPRPVLPPAAWGEIDPQERKDFKRRAWLAPAALAASGKMRDHLQDCPFVETFAQSHNSINPATGTTGGGPAYAPFTHERHQYHGEVDVYAVIDAGRFPADDLQALLTDVGAYGYGADASAGLGKFAVASLAPHDFPAAPQANALLTLAPCAVPPGIFDETRCWYKVFVRFGRHGNLSALGPAPFKSPALLLDTGATLTPRGALPPSGFVGRGLGGLSAEAGTVQQGYAPVAPFVLRLEQSA